MKRFVILFPLLLALLCAGCGAKPSPAPSAPEPPAPAEAAPSQDTTEEPETLPEKPEDPDEALVTLETLVDGGQYLRLEAIGHQRAEMDQYGVREIRVYHGDTLLQTLSVQEAIDTDGVCGALGEGYTDCWTLEDLLTVKDMNFDGIDDISLFAWTPAGGNIPHYYWLWDSATRSFRYGFCLANATPDPETEQIFCDLADVSGYTTEIYRYSDTDTLEMVYSVSEHYRPDGTREREVYQLIDGVWTKEE